MSPLTHLDEEGRARMVDVSGKAETARLARAACTVTMAPETLAMVRQGTAAKGDVLAVARLAGIMAAKRTADLIPLCHGLSPDSVAVDFDVPTLLPDPADQTCRLRVHATATVHAKTGVEMEALTAVSVAALTVYDMCKAIDKSMTIDGIRLLRKTGGKSDYHAEP